MFVLAAAAWVVAAEGDSGPDFVGYLLNYGVLGVLTVLWISGQLKTGKDVAAERARAEAAELRERELNTALRTEVIPALTRFTDTAARILERDGHRA